MVQPLFDFDLKRVSRRHYITGKAAINFPHPECSTGGWHFLSYFDREAGVVKLSLAGIHYPDTDAFFGDMGISDVTEQLRKRGWPVAQASDSANTACSPTDTYVRLVLSLLIRQRVHRASRWSVLHNVGRKQALRRLSHYPMTVFTEISDFADPLAERPIEHAVTSR